MAWIEYHTALRDHWKIQRLSDRLKIEYTQALGSLSCLWLWAVDNCDKRGNLTRFTDEELCNAARIAVKFPLKSCLKECELLDEKNCINDWSKHGVKYLLSSRKRTKEWRKGKGKRDVTVTSPQRNGDSYQPTNLPTYLPTNLPREEGMISRFDEFWSKYPKPVGMHVALMTYRATVKTEQDFKDLMTALEHYKASDECKGGYLKNGDKWIEDWRGWLAMPPKKESVLDKFEVRK